MQQKNPSAGGFPEYNGFNLPELEKEILTYWQQHNVFEKSISEKPEDNTFVFYEGPPSANGKPGIHHVMSRTIKDLFCRFKTLQGYRVIRKAGWDTHGLPVELNVEKQLGITKADIGTKISIADYNAACRKNVMEYTDVWNDLTTKMGYWVDLSDPYITYEKEYIETLWYLLKMFYDKGLLYKGFTIQPFSPAAGTGLSSHELNQPGTYRDVKDITAVAQFKVIKNEKSAFLFDEENEDVRILAWTTTPWTLPSNVALAVGADIDYVKIKTWNQYTGKPVSVVLAEKTVPSFFHDPIAELRKNDPIYYYSSVDARVDNTLQKDFIDKESIFNTTNRIYKNYELLFKNEPHIIYFQNKYGTWNINSSHKYTGSQLKDISYEPLLPYNPNAACRVIIGDFVTTSDGTGIVHIAPSHGADDKRVADENGIAGVLLVDRQGRFTAEVTDFAGEYVKEDYLTKEEKHHEAQKQGREHYLNVDIRIIDKLKKENKLFKKENYEHTYPHCWRTDKPILYYPLDSWFIKTTAVKDRLIALNKTINWKPASTGEGRFGQWLENLVDWNLSRSRYWGTPLPIWRTEDGKEEICIGSIDELTTAITNANQSGLLPVQSTEITDLHKPIVDEIKLISPSGKIMLREADLIDVWFDSGAMPYAQYHWPFENKEKYPFSSDKKSGFSFPADFIAEGVDQTRGWFFTLHVIAVALFDSVAYKNVVSNGLLLDAKGQKMSKRLGNVVDPFETIAKYGADATRWYMMRNSDPWDNLKFDLKGLEESSRALFGTLYNTYSFFALYANIDKWTYNPAATIPNADKPEIDRWILSKLHTLLKDVTAYYSDYEPLKVTRAIEQFVDNELSNWYVRLCRRRFWKGEMSEDKQAAYETLYECLITVAQLMSPIAPFFSDWLYQSLHQKNGNSVHLSNLPIADNCFIDESLEERMELAQRISSLILSLRKKSLIKVRQPLSKVLIPIISSHQKEQIEKVESYILNEVNVKEIEYVVDTSGIVKKKAKPNFKTLGKKVGANMKEVQAAILNFSQSDIANFEKEQQYTLSIAGNDFVLTAEDIELISEDIEGWLVAVDGNVTVALDIHISEQLRNEGNARELVNKIQNLRKEKGFEVLDRIYVTIENDVEIAAAVTNFREYIANEVLANEIILADAIAAGDSIEFNEKTITLNIRK